MIKSCITVLREIQDNSVDFVFIDSSYAPDFYSGPKWDKCREELERIRR